MSPDVDYSAGRHRGRAAFSVLGRKGAEFRYVTLFDLPLGADKRTNSSRSAERSVLNESPSSTGLRRVHSAFLQGTANHVRLYGLGLLRPERATFAPGRVASGACGFHLSLCLVCVQDCAQRYESCIARRCECQHHRPICRLTRFSCWFSARSSWRVICPPSWLAIKRSSRRIWWSSRCRRIACI
ncbi:hypothetical protein PMI06_009939 [Burkholderia sp. BT03]|nr:hypothetical protein PMI06_009939 [Burkholderia sp. BT03]